MKVKRFKEEQIIRILQEAEASVAVADLCRKHNCWEQSFYRWKAKYGDMKVSDAKRLNELQRERETFVNIWPKDRFGSLAAVRPDSTRMAGLGR